MRISRFGLLSCGLALIGALPCLGQSAPAATANPLSGLIAPGVQQKMQESLQQHLQQKLSQTFNAKMFSQARALAAPHAMAQRRCYDLQVFRFQKGYPENNALAQPSVSECESAARVHLKNLVTGVQVLQMGPKH